MYKKQQRVYAKGLWEQIGENTGNKENRVLKWL